MTKLERLESEIAELSPEELAKLRVWLCEFDADAWDKQIEEDVKAGRLDVLMKEALDEYNRGECTDL